MKYYGITDKGMIREQNQDCIYLSENLKYNLYILADGMGGANAGDIASKKSIEYVKEYISQNYIIENENNIKELLKNSITYANMKIYKLSKLKKEYEGMGTTLVVALYLNNKIYIAHVGDSSAYRIRKDIIRKITKDHSYVQKLLDDKSITKKEAKDHPKKNILLRAVGCEENVEVDVTMKKLQINDYLLLCSDGLTNMLKDKEILLTINTLNDCESICKKLVSLSNDRGGYDNISIILLHNSEV